MPLSQSDIRRVGDYVRGELPRWLASVAPWVTGSGLLERAIRVEEELRSQRELMAAHFVSVDKRFEAVDRRFEDMNKRIGGMQWLIGVGMVMLGTMVSLYQFLA